MGLQSNELAIRMIRPWLLVMSNEPFARGWKNFEETFSYKSIRLLLRIMLQATTGAEYPGQEKFWVPVFLINWARQRSKFYSAGSANPRWHTCFCAFYVSPLRHHLIDMFSKESLTNRDNKRILNARNWICRYSLIIRGAVMAYTPSWER